MMPANKVSKVRWLAAQEQEKRALKEQRI